MKIIDILLGGWEYREEWVEEAEMFTFRSTLTSSFLSLSIFLKDSEKINVI